MSSDVHSCQMYHHNFALFVYQHSDTFKVRRLFVVVVGSGPFAHVSISFLKIINLVLSTGDAGSGRCIRGAPRKQERM